MKVLITATVLSHICQFHLSFMEYLQSRGYEVHVAARDNLMEKNGLELKHCDRYIPIPFARSPKSPENIRAHRKLKKHLEQEHYDLILCNTPMGGIVTRLAAREARKTGTKVIYMAHGLHFYQGAPKKNWLVFYPIEKFMTRFCDMMITINKEDYALACERFKGIAVKHIHGVGVRTDRYQPADSSCVPALREMEDLSEQEYVILCTGELNGNKDQKTLISAAAQLRDKIPNLKVLLAGNGPKESELRDQIAAESIENTVKLLGYRTDLENLVPAVNLVVSCSKREGLGLNIIEAMLCRVPVVCSVNRGHLELVCEGENGYLFQPGDYHTLADRIWMLYQNPQLAEKLGCCGEKMAQVYTVESVMREMDQILQ